MKIFAFVLAAVILTAPVTASAGGSGSISSSGSSGASGGGSVGDAGGRTVGSGR